MIDSSSDNFCSVFFQSINAFARRASGRYHVLDDQNSIILLNGKSSSQSHDTIFPFGPNKPNTQRLSRRKSDYKPAYGRRRDSVNVVRNPVAIAPGSDKTLCDLTAIFCGISRILQRQRTLQIF